MKRGLEQTLFGSAWATIASGFAACGCDREQIVEHTNWLIGVLERKLEDRQSPDLFSCEAPSCRRMFFKTRPHQRFCSEACGNTARTAAFRARRKKRS